LAAEAEDAIARAQRRAQSGGEEFVAVCPGTGHEEGLLLAERLRWTIETSVKTPDDSPITVVRFAKSSAAVRISLEPADIALAFS
ncbi:hypothetical protein ACC754_41310, partial [Rhizobium johnstonii]